MEKASGWYSELVKKAEFSYFSIMSMVILIGSCWGAIATMMIFQSNGSIIEVGIALAGTMAANTAAIGQAPIRWLLNLAFISFFINTLLIVIHLFH